MRLPRRSHPRRRMPLQARASAMTQAASVYYPPQKEAAVRLIPRVLFLVPAFLLAVFQVRPATQTVDFDILIRNGQLLDGTGASAQRADVGVRDGRITEIGSLANRSA